MTYHTLSANWVRRVLVYRFSRSGVGFAREVRAQRAMTTSGVVYISSGIWMLMVGSTLMSEGGLWGRDGYQEVYWGRCLVTRGYSAFPLHGCDWLMEIWALLMTFEADLRGFCSRLHDPSGLSDGGRGVRRYPAPRRERRVYCLRELDSMCHRQAVKPSRKRATWQEDEENRLERLDRSVFCFTIEDVMLQNASTTSRGRWILAPWHFGLKISSPDQ